MSKLQLSYQRIREELVSLSVELEVPNTALDRFIKAEYHRYVFNRSERRYVSCFASGWIKNGTQ